METYASAEAKDISRKNVNGRLFLKREATLTDEMSLRMEQVQDAPTNSLPLRYTHYV